MHGLLRCWRYLWASPNTLLGLSIAAIACLTGGSLAIVRGVVEVQGGFATTFLRRGVPLIGSAAAMTLGHVILGQMSTAWNAPAITSMFTWHNTRSGARCFCCSTGRPVFISG